MKYMVKPIWIMILGFFMLAMTIQAAPQTLVNDVFWKDTDGNFIYSQGGGGIWVGDTYYWYGVKYKSAEIYTANPVEKNGDIGFLGITCYSSKDLVNWKNEGLALAPSETGGGWIGRFGVAYNANTKKYVLAGQGSGPSGGYGEYFATSSTPDGPFTFANVQTDLSFFVNGGTGDQTVFQDDDGKAYIICSNVSGRSNLYVAPLRESDFLAIEPNPTRIYRGTGREGNAMFKQNGIYYFCSSDLHGWNTSQTYCMSSTNILGPYSNEFVLKGTEADYSHVTQTGFFIPIKGSEGSFTIYAGDRWSNFAGNGIGFNQWLPITIENSTPLFHSLSEWNIDVAKGTWSVGAGNNYSLNPSFEADRIKVSQLTGWDVNPIGGDVNSTSNKKTGRFGLYLSGIKTVSQTVHVPNGTYTLSAWVRSSGGQSDCELFADDFGATKRATTLKNSINNWTKISIPDIRVSNGKITIGVQVNSTSSQWVNLDDFELLQSGPSHAISTTASPGGVILQEPAGATLTEGSQVAFTAVPLEGWQFTGWTGDHTGTQNPYTIASLNANVQLGATFTFVGTDSTVYEGENTKYTNAMIEEEHPGFSGSGYINFENVIGSSVEFNVVSAKAGDKLLTITYANGAMDERPVSISVNGEVIEDSFGFTPTETWEMWAAHDVKIQLNSGVNTIVMTSVTQNGGPNIDKIELSEETQRAILNKYKVAFIPSTFNTSTKILNVGSENTLIQLFSIDGTLILNKTLKSSEYQLPMQLSKGLYFLRIKSANQESLFKVIQR